MSDQSTLCVAVVLRTTLHGILNRPVASSEQPGTFSSCGLLPGKRSLNDCAPVTVRLTSLNCRQPDNILVQLINMLACQPRNEVTLSAELANQCGMADVCLTAIC